MSRLALHAAYSVAALAIMVGMAADAVACPFCTAIRPTLSQRREAAAVVVLAECIEPRSDATTFRLHRILQRSERLPQKESLTLPITESLKAGSLVLLLADGEGEKPLAEWTWSVERANEAGLAYFAQAPSLKSDAVERLRYFARFLEHPDPWIAEDAYNEFGHAPYDVVAQVADDLSSEKLRSWMTSERVLPARKGFYGMALGLAGPDHERAPNRRFLERLVLQPADDFRAGFDGVLAGYLLSAGPAALDQIEARFLANPDAADGDVRHAVSALRFYQEFGREIPQRRLNRALRHLLSRPEFAAAAIVDLARWRDWEPVEQIARLYTTEPGPPSATKRAIVGYLLSCPEPAARLELARLRQLDPLGIDAFSRNFRFSDAFSDTGQ